MLISIEGNIGSGKSTIINFLKTLDSENIIFIDEPVDEWRKIKVDGKNALEIFYEDLSKNSFWFQILAYITRLRNLLNTVKENPNKIIISERSIYTDKFIFAQMLYEQEHLSEIEMKTYSYWFDTFEKETKLDLVLYVNTEPEECFERIKKRNREEESNISIDYISHCHKKHLDWLENTNIKIIEINGHQSIENIQAFMTNIINNNFN
jgi:deoxyadenosine/deoxycytidine kinase